ncbi:MAG: DUF58 domain-containing protein [Dehalococcoidia bacterium]|nr:MAG: DUF58 domain-containing protein [Dehalococcoidia bacterium]
MKRQKIFVVVVLVALLALALVSGSILIMRLFFLSVLVTAASYVWVRLSLRRLSVDSTQPPERLEVGDTFQREVIISNPGKLPRLWLKVGDATDLPGHQDMAIINVARQSSYCWQANFKCRKRGRYHLGPVILTAADPLEIFTSTRALGKEQEIIVYPATIDLPVFNLASFSGSGYRSGYQSIKDIRSHASSVREFTSGDSLHHIHWRSTAHMGKLMVKTFDADRSYNPPKVAWILLDMNEKAHFGRGEETSEEYTITMAASMVKRCLQSGMQVGILASDERHSLITPETGEQQLWDILETFALMKANKELTLSKLSSYHLDSFHHNPLVIIIATSASENLVEVVTQLNPRVASMVVILVDAASFGGPPWSSQIAQTLIRSGVQVYATGKDTNLVKVTERQGHATLSATRVSEAPCFRVKAREY